MSEVVFPFIRMSQGGASPGPDSPTSAWAMFGSKAISLQHEDLKSLHWSWNLKDYVMESHPDRVRQFYTALHGSIANQEYSERTLCIRYVQTGTGCPLKSMLIIRVDGNPDAIQEIAEQSWQEVSSTFPYDYVLNPISSESDFIEETGQAWLENKNPQTSIVNFQPAIGTVNGFSGSNSNPVPVLGMWNATATSAENIWRALHNYPHPIMLDVLLKPTSLRGDELAALDLMMVQVQELIDKNENHPIVKIQAQQWFDILSQRVRYFAPLFIVQVRLVSPQEIHPYLTRVIGTALTYGSISDQNEPYQGYLAQFSDSSTTLDWAHKIATLDLIEIALPLPSILKKLTMTISTPELPYVAPFFLTPKGGISNLHLEEA